MPLVTVLPLLALFAKTWTLMKFLLYRAFVWAWVVRIFRQGRARGSRALCALAVLVYIASWALVGVSLVEVGLWIARLLPGH